jgi:mono/diheme cytochrome c family protein
MAKKLLAAVTAITLCYGASPFQKAPAKAIVRANPYEGQDPAWRAGRKLFERECSACHGKSGQGSKGKPVLASREVADAKPGALEWLLRNGSIVRGMPSFSQLPEAQRWQIVTFLQTLAPESSHRH